ncbi:MAG: hypothetical protein KDI43_15635 [Gammaproteobacteria bacterium]|nr:hypothetical protein [Gammaproteobacteria bacterium]
MERYWTKTHSFTDGAARFFDLCYFTLNQDDLAEEEVPHTVFCGFDQQLWYQYSHVNWTAVGIVFATQPDDKAVAISEDGNVWTYFSGKEKTESFKEKPRLIRNISVIEGEVYACGMDRQVYRRFGENNWRGMHAPKPGKGETLGFEAIAGFSKNEIYAVGWDGEVWRAEKGDWQNCDSPVNAILTGVHCSNDGFVYVCGQDGVILRGRRDTWEFIGDENVTDDLWDVVEFKGKIYFASKSDIYVLDNNKLEQIMPETDNIETAGRFTSREEVLWSIGDKDVFSFDGNTWTRVD